MNSMANLLPATFEWLIMIYRPPILLEICPCAWQYPQIQNLLFPPFRQLVAPFHLFINFIYRNFGDSRHQTENELFVRIER